MVDFSETQAKTIKSFVAHPRGSGYVLDYSDSSFYAMFKDSWRIDIDDNTYRERGNSKGNRLICFCQLEDAGVVCGVLKQLYQEALEIGIRESDLVTEREITAFESILSDLALMEPARLHDSDHSANIKPAAIGKNSQRNSHSIMLVVSATLESLGDFREVVRADNMLGAEQPDVRDRLLKLLDALILHLELLLKLLPMASVELSREQTSKLASWTDRYVNAAIPKLQEYVSPEALGNTSVPVGVILLCGSVGSLLTGFSPIGFGAGSFVGKMITGEMKSGAAADKLNSSLSED